MKRIRSIGRLFFVFRGRLSLEMWWLTKGILLAFIFLVYYLMRIPLLGDIFALGGAAFFLWSGLVLNIKRFHDRNLPGWLLFVQLIPVLGSIYCYVHLAFLRGNPGGNMYGPPPKPLGSWWIF